MAADRSAGLRSAPWQVWTRGISPPWAKLGLLIFIGGPPGRTHPSACGISVRSMSDLLSTVAEALARSRRLLFVTGAGISADSGLPTYRGVGGLYDAREPDEGLPIEEILSGPTFRREPALCWRHLARIEAACRGARPNDAHLAIAALERDREVVVLTQNVDGLHRAAGSTDVIEVHGDLHRLRCPSCGWRESVADYAALALPPRCPACGAVIRPDVVLFGEALPTEAVARMEAMERRPFDLVVSIGTTSAFPYVAAPVVRQVRAGRPALEINPGDTAVSGVVTWRLRMGAAAALRALTGGA